MKFNCAQCGEPRKVDHKVAKYYLGTAFCGVECLEGFIREMTPIDLTLYPQIRPVNPGDVPNGYECWSHRLGQGFRSGFECVVAEKLVLDWGMRVLYESVCFQIDDKHTYTPDFYAVDFGVFLEVKGAWGIGSAKHKFHTAQGIVGKDRMLLIPAPYRNWFAKK